MKKTLLFLCLTAIFLSSEVHAQRITKQKVRRIFQASGVYDQHYTGFELYDSDKKKVIYEYNANKHAIPASNTKLFTLYTALHMLPDSIPGIRCLRRNDSLIIWGTGDPSFLNPEIKSTRVFDFLKNTPLKLFYADGRYSSSLYRVGQTSYNPELTAMPVNENTVTIYRNGAGGLSAIPARYTDSLVMDTAFHPRTFTIRRSEQGNRFIYPAMPVPDKFVRRMALRTSPLLAAQLLQDTLKRSVGFLKMSLPSQAKTLFSIPADTLYKKMMLPSDNYIAEQLLIVCSSMQNGPLNQDSVIRYARKNILTGLPDDFQWDDGSGLSRYNLFTPRTIIQLLINIEAKLATESRVRELFPAGGVNGTLKNAYKVDNGQPFVWAKTGTLSNVHIQGGYVITRKGRRLIYSFMNNNFLVGTAAIRSEMGRVITEIHEKF